MNLLASSLSSWLLGLVFAMGGTQARAQDADDAGLVIIDFVPTDTAVLGRYTVPAGVYMSAAEFASRKPSYLGSVEYYPVEYLSDRMGGMLVDKGEIVLPGFNGMRDEDVRKRVFAFCTGKEVYLNGITVDDNCGFHKVHNKQGPLLCSEILDGSRYSLADLGRGGLIGAAVHGDGTGRTLKTMPLVFNFTNWQIVACNRDEMRTLLASHPDLLAMMDAEKGSKEMEHQHLFPILIE